MLAAAVVWKKRLSTPSTTASEFARSVITSRSGRRASNPRKFLLLDIGYVVDNVLPPFQGEKRVVFLAILVVAQHKRRNCMTKQTFLIVIWFSILGTCLVSKSDAIENAWIA